MDSPALCLAFTHILEAPLLTACHLGSTVELEPSQHERAGKLALSLAGYSIGELAWGIASELAPCGVGVAELAF